jgi:hypothetical protein
VLRAPSCRHRRHLEALEGFGPVCITGRQDKTQKDDAVTAFARGDTNLCLISLRTATGIDGLQKRARVVVFAELDWSPAVHRQAEDRAHRMGQRDSVLAYYLVTDLGTDPFVMMTLNLKASQFTGLMQDRTETDDDRRDADAAAKDHMAGRAVDAAGAGMRVHFPTLPSSHGRVPPSLRNSDSACVYPRCPGYPQVQD